MHEEALIFFIFLSSPVTTVSLHNTIILIITNNNPYLTSTIRRYELEAKTFVENLNKLKASILPRKYQDGVDVDLNMPFNEGTLSVSGIITIPPGAPLEGAGSSSSSSKSSSAGSASSSAGSFARIDACSGSIVIRCLEEYEERGCRVDELAIWGVFCRSDQRSVELLFELCGRYVRRSLGRG